jgi:hypothetical protein
MIRRCGDRLVGDTERILEVDAIASVFTVAGCHDAPPEV